MRKFPGISVYLSTFQVQKPLLERVAGTGVRVFISLHVSEEFSPSYCAQAEESCRWLSGAGFNVIADISVKTIKQFNEPDLVRLAKRLGIWALRVDYGLTEDQIMDLAREMPVAINASTVTPESARRLAGAGSTVMAMHNFYPRPETGLDDDFYRERTRALQDMGLHVTAFIPGDGLLRGPLHEGLPTLERHRGLPPSVCLADMENCFESDGIFIADPGLSEGEFARMKRYCSEDILELPATLSKGYQNLYGQVFTCRADSPKRLIRFMESREYSCAGAYIEPQHCVNRPRGSVTIDNGSYDRYSGELQITRADLPADPRVNVIGQIQPAYLLMADAVRRGGRFVLTPA